MIIGVTADGPTLESNISMMAARAPYFLIIEKNGEEIKLREAIQNTWMGRGAGPRAAQTFISHGVEVVITSRAGPNFQALLENSGVRIVQATGRVIDAVKQL